MNPALCSSPGHPLARREFLHRTAAGVAAALAGGPLAAAPAPPRPQIPFGYSLYNLRKIEVDQALRLCAETGYDCVEFVANAGWPTDPKTLSAAERRRLRDLVQSLGLFVPAIMENLNLLAAEDLHHANLDRIKEAADLGHLLLPKGTPIIETVLGGKPDQWKQVKDRMAERLATWAETATAAKVVIAVKAHVGGALHTPEDARWLVRQVNSPWIKLTYDFSHFELRGYKLGDSLATMIGQTRFVHIKDSTGTAEKFQFLLPGEGKLDYVDYLTRLKDFGYRDSVVVEVSGMISNKPDFDPVAAARSCYARLAPAFAKAGVRSLKSAG